MEENPDDEAGFNISYLALFDAGFAYTQTLGIRRLTENPNSNPSKGVISLRRVLKEIMDNRDLITREVYVSYDGLPYDYQTAYNEWLKKAGINHVGSVPYSGPEAWGASDNCHKSFDRLSKVSESSRNRDDLISLDWFQKLNDEIDQCNDVSTYVNKFIAHAADPVSRQNLTPDQTKITLNKFADCHKAICRVANFIFSHILYEGASAHLVPIPQFDHLEDIDKPLISTNDLNVAYVAWEQNVSEIDNWEKDFPWPDDPANSN